METNFLSINNETIRSRIGCMNSLVLKLIAVSTMLIDHMGAVLFPQYLVMRMIGRIAFPIYVFLLVEGFYYTKDVKKYIGRMAVFALLSEYPFDLAFSNVMPDWSSQNVFFTLMLGLLMLVLIRTYENNRMMQGIFVIAFAILALLMMTDYKYGGIILILVFYKFRDRPVIRFLFTALLFFLIYGSIEMYGLIAFIPIFMYNGKKGWDGRRRTESGWQKTPLSYVVQYGFYAFYPIHLLILGLVG